MINRERVQPVCVYVCVRACVQSSGGVGEGWGRWTSKARRDDTDNGEGRDGIQVSKDLGIWKGSFLQFWAVSKVPGLVLQCVCAYDIFSCTKLLTTR